MYRAGENRVNRVVVGCREDMKRLARAGGTFEGFYTRYQYGWPPLVSLCHVCWAYRSD